MKNADRAIVAVVAIFLSLLSGPPAHAQREDQNALIAAMHPKSGKIKIANDIVELNIGPNFKYLDNVDATTMVTKIMGNPPGAAEGNLGMIMPTKKGESWFAILSYSADGHVADDDAAKIDYDALLTQMKEQTEKDSGERRNSGFPGIKLLGWAQRPYYDPITKKIYWAKSIQFDDEPSPTLNYDVRILGRTGYLNLKIVDSMDQLPKINAEMPEILSLANFTQGNRYQDYVAGSDHMAAYGIAGLVAGGILAKAGFFKGLLVVAAAFWKLIAAAVVAFFATVGNFVRRLFGRKPVQ